jgi:hypothetical protein
MRRATGASSPGLRSTSAEMTAIAPHRFAPRVPEPEALIEEARCRARLRRVAYAVAALLLGAAIWAGFALTSGGPAPTVVAPPGFHLVKSKGDVEHQVIETRDLLQPSTIELKTGRQQPTRTTDEVWFDSRTGLARVVIRLDGRIQWDQVVPCNDTRYGSCVPGYSFATKSPLDSRDYVREPGTYRFHGHDVIWAGKRYNGFPPAPGTGERVGIDIHTHQPVAYRNLEEGSPVSASWVTAPLKDIPGGHYWFVVPDGGVGGGYPQSSSQNEFTVSPETTLLSTRTRRVLGRTPLWLGRMFDGQPLQTITIGSEVLEARSGLRLSKTPFVSYRYGRFSVQEFGAAHPNWYRRGPRAGTAVVERFGGFMRNDRTFKLTPVATEWRAALSRNGLLVVVQSLGDEPYPLTRTRVQRIARALRPVP